MAEERDEYLSRTTGKVRKRRKDGWTPREPKYTRGVLGKYAKVVQSAAHGAVCG